MDPQVLHRQNDGRTGRDCKGDVRVSAFVAAKAPEIEDLTHLQKANVTGLVLFVCKQVLRHSSNKQAADDSMSRYL